MADDVLVGVEDPLTPDVRALLEEHVREMHETSPPESVHALDPESLRSPSITVYAARTPQGLLLGVGALKQHDDGFGELKSMRTRSTARGRGVASAVLTAVIAECRSRGIRELALETGTEAYFGPARALYARHGFTARGPFADYTDDPNSVYLSLAL